MPATIALYRDRIYIECKEYRFKSDHINRIHIKVHTRQCILCRGSNIVLLNPRGERNVKPGSRRQLCALLSRPYPNIDCASSRILCLRGWPFIRTHRTAQTEFVFGSLPAWEIDSAPSAHFRRLPFCISGEMSRLNHNY